MGISANIEVLTYQLLGEKLTANSDEQTPYFDKSYVNWAIKLMILGYDSESLVILAGLDYETSEEREKYFLQALNELQIDTKLEDLVLIDYYAKFVAEEAIKGKISPHNGLIKMNEIVLAIGYSRYKYFYELEDDLSTISYCGIPSWNTGINLENQDEFIFDSFKRFLKLDGHK